MFDVLIHSGTVIDGSGAARYVADVALQGNTIAAIGSLQHLAARERIDANGRIVAPGFIDVHTHDDQLLLAPPLGAHPKLSQGVTTVVTGNCGISLAPLLAQSPPAPLDLLGAGNFRFDSFASYLDALRRQQPAVNAACLVGHTTLRVRHMVALDRPANAVEITGMQADLDLALAAGAFGLSTGVYYPPACAATADEVIAVGRPLAVHDGILTMHIRDEGDAIDAALREALHVGKTLGVSCVLSHHKLVGKANHGRSVQTLELLEAAALGQPLCIDCYPYHASSTMLLPGRVQQSSDIWVTWSEAEPEVCGRSLFELARERRVTPEELAVALQPAGAIYFAMCEDDVSRIVCHPLSMIGSDGLAHDLRPHPRLWGTFPRVLGHYVRERKLLSLETAIYKMTGMSARRFGLRERGILAVGNFADVVVFDEQRIIDRATFEHPTQASAGIDAVIVNGQLACAHGCSVNMHAGRVLRR